MNCAEVIYIIIGAVLGFLTSILTIVVERILDRKGKLHIFYRLSNSRGFGEDWGFTKNVSGKIDFCVPIVCEIQNISNTTRVIRDVSVMLYKGNDVVEKMIQIDHMHSTNIKGKEITSENDFFFGTDKGSYSFVIAPRSIQRQECEYLLIMNQSEFNNSYFDNIRIRYYDEKNREKTYKVRDIDTSTVKTFKSDPDWILLK